MSDDFLSLLEGLGGDDVAKKEKTRETIIKSPFGYPGGKSRSLEHLLPLLPKTERYVEVFGGSGVVLLNRDPVKFEVFNDRYSGIVDFYNCIRDSENLDKLIKYLRDLPYSREMFLTARETWTESEDVVVRAALWYYMIENSFGCQGRNFARDLKKTHNRITGHFPIFRKVHWRLRNTMIENLDWRDCLTDFDDHETVFYLDPPYMNESTSGNMYRERGMTKSDHIELCDRIFELEGFVALSGYKNEIYEQYSWDHIEKWDVFISMTGLAFTENNAFKGREEAIERGNRTEYLYIKEV